MAPSTPLPPSLLRPRASAGSPHSLSLVGSGCWDWVPPITLAQLLGLPQRVPTELPPGDRSWCHPAVSRICTQCEMEHKADGMMQQMCSSDFGECWGPLPRHPLP